MNVRNVLEVAGLVLLLWVSASVAAFALWLKVAKRNEP